jgi:putative aldouronate transport system substrate-binding protein
VFYGAPPLSGKYQGYYIGRNEISGLFGIMTSSSKIEDAVKFLDYALSNEAQQYYCWGIEGESYTTDSSGNKKFTAAASDDMWLQNLGINPGCLPSRQSVDAVDAHLPKWHVDLDRQMVQYVKKPFPFIFATTAETQVEQGYTDNIEKYVKQKEKEFITGATSLSTFDNFMKTLKSMNIDNVINVKQEQYNRYMQAYR